MSIEYVRIEKNKNKKYSNQLLLLSSGFHLFNFNSIIFALFFFDTLLSIIWFFIVQYTIIRYIIYKNINANTISAIQLILLLTTLFFIGWNNILFWSLLALQIYNYIYLRKLKNIL